MFFLIILVLVALIVLLLGGKLKNLTYIRFKFAWLALLAITVKIVSIAGFFDDYGLSYLIPVLRAASMILILAFIGFNINLRGMPLVLIGLLSNALVIWANGGKMPVSENYARLAFSAKEITELAAGNNIDSFVLANSNTKLNFLGDVLPMPEWIPLTKLFSIGDILVAIGAAIFIVYYLKFNHKTYLSYKKL
ncbi:DUF5317 domain-containing protein [Desulfotruncus alcoholivorax]|uniref:DUF5317 domain-containing protein n=1 Tax=Desulfotruncus alcoholivorax TaxID=265477 RepID=UPI0004040E15|nr:DUF5317 domain-containing protein [Desulfotruncus alcoholivorax]